MAPDPWLVGSGLIVLGLGAFHSVLGEIYLVRRLLRRDNLPKLFGGDSFTKLTIRYAWHLLTLFCVAASALLFWAATHDFDAAWAATHPASGGREVVMVLFTLLVASGLWGLVATRGRHLSWVVLLVAAACAFVGADLGPA